MKKSISLLLTLVLVFSLFSSMCVSTSAETPTEPISTINKYWQMKQISVTDNNYFTDVLVYNRDDHLTMINTASDSNDKQILVYSTGNFADKVFTYDESGTLKDWITTGGNYRFWIKTPNLSGQKINLTMNFTASINTNNANNTENYYYNKSNSVNSDFEVVADGKWHEVIADFSNISDAQKADLYSLAPAVAKSGYTLTGDETQAAKTDFTIKYVYNSAIEINKKDLQFSNIEFHFSEPTAIGDGNLVIPTEPISTITKYWQMKEISVTDNNYFTDALIYNRDDHLTMKKTASDANDKQIFVYSTGNLADKVFTYGVGGTLKAWITTGGNYRFWIKTPDLSGQTINLTMNFTADINTKDTSVTDYYYNKSNSVNSDFDVVADGKWHEVIADFSSSTDAQKADLYALAPAIAKSGYTLTGDEPQAAKTNFAIKFVYNSDIEINKKDLQFSNIEFHFSEPTAIGDGNFVIPTEPISTITPYWHMKQTSVTDNNYFTDALIYNRGDHLTMINTASDANDKQIFVYNTGNATDKVFTYGVGGTLKAWITTGGNYRFWIKTPDLSGQTINLTMNFTASINTNNANNTENYYYNKSNSVNSDFEVVADGKWHEVIADFSNISDAQKADLYSLAPAVAKSGYTLTGDEPQAAKTDFTVKYVYNSAIEINKKDLQFSNIEFHFSEPTAIGDGNKGYSKIAALNNICDSATQTYVLKGSAIMYRTMVDCEDLPFFNKANTYSTNETYVANNGNVTKGFLRINNKAVWDYIGNPDAELRFWVRTATTKSFALNITIRNNAGLDNTITLKNEKPITVEGKEGWQEVIVPRSWFQDNPSANFIAASKQSDCKYVQFGFTVLGSETNGYKANTSYSTFAANDCIEFSNVIEMYSDKAYDKGDANCDEKVDILDLVRTKKQSVMTDANVCNSDINNDNLIDATDLIYMRKYLICGSWQ